MNYPEIKKHCEEESALSRAVIDEFLIYYAAATEKLEPKIDAHLKKYKKAAHDLPIAYINFLKSEYIAHRIFRKEGYIKKYLNRPEIRSRPSEQYQYLELHAQFPWRFSFAQIRRRPADALFEMEDIMTGDSYLLYSPGMKASEEEHHPRLWFNLIAYNGQCWQTFGLIIFFKSFSTDDIFFFATELNPRIEDEEMLMKEVENNPFPFLMLLSASILPVIVSRGYETVLCRSTDALENFSTENLSIRFNMAWNKGIYRLESKKKGGFPHFAVAFYHEGKKELLRTASTETGFRELTIELSNAGYELNPESDIAVSPGMLAATEKILDKRIPMTPYEKLFEKERTPVESENLKRMNRFLDLAMPVYNAQKEPDLKRLAEEAGIDEKTASGIWEAIKENMENMRKKYNP